MTRGRLFAKGLWNGFSWGGIIGFFPIYILAASKGRSSSWGSGSGEWYLGLAILSLVLLGWGVLATVVGTLVGLGIGIARAVTRKPKGTPTESEKMQLTTDLAELGQNEQRASKFTEILINRYEHRRTPKSKSSRGLVKELKSGYNASLIKSYLTNDSNDGKRLYRLIHEVLGESKQSSKGGRTKINARVLRLGKHDPQSPLSRLPKELLIKIATFARPEGMDANAAQQVAQDIIHPVELMTPGR